MALICACLPVTRGLFNAGISKISSHSTKRNWLCLGGNPAPHSTEGKRTFGLSRAANPYVKNDFDKPPTSPSPSPRLSSEASRKEYHFPASSPSSSGRIGTKEKKGPHAQADVLYHDDHTNSRDSYTMHDMTRPAAAVATVAETETKA